MSLHIFLTKKIERQAVIFNKVMKKHILFSPPSANPAFVFKVFFLQGNIQTMVNFPCYETLEIRLNFSLLVL